MFILLVIFGIFLEIIVIGGGLYLFLKQKKSKPKTVIKISSTIKPIELPQIRNKTIVKRPYDSIYTTNSMRETPVKRSGGDLVPYGLSDADKELLEMFYDNN